MTNTNNFPAIIKTVKPSERLEERRFQESVDGLWGQINTNCEAIDTARAEIRKVLCLAENEFMVQILGNGDVLKNDVHAYEAEPASAETVEAMNKFIVANLPNMNAEVVMNSDTNIAKIRYSIFMTAWRKEA